MGLPRIQPPRRKFPIITNRRQWMYLIYLLVLLGALLAPPSGAAPEDGDSSSSSSSSSSWYVQMHLQGLGTLRGIRTWGGSTPTTHQPIMMDFFGGIPYAAPPVGNLRWAPPEEPPSWKPHTLDATQFGPDCYQVVDSVMNPLADPLQLSEDCLYLNVYTPASGAAVKVNNKQQQQQQQHNNNNNHHNNNNNHHNNNNNNLPVMVWFHGGAFQQGAAKRPEYDARRLAEDYNVVVVTANYRLGSLGFLVSSELGLFGNYGLMDQRAVLYWVQKHIESFGGDSNSITLFGESAGAVMIGLHLLMANHHTHRGLFHRAILQSNPMGYQFRSVVVADFLGDALKRAVDCKDLACLRGEPVEEIMRAQSSLMGIPRSVGDFFAWGPTLTVQRHVHFTPAGKATTTTTSSSSSSSSSSDFSTTLLMQERSMFSVENYAKQRESSKFDVNVTQPLLNLHLVPDEIPIIIGTNKHEGEMFVHSAFPLTMSKAVYWMFVGALFKDSASRVLKHYRPYVAQLEAEAQAVAEQQLLEEENRQHYLDHQDELEQEYAWLLAQNGSVAFPADIMDAARQIISPETVQKLVHTFDAGGGGEDGDGEEGSLPLSSSSTDNVTARPVPWWRRPLERFRETPDAQLLAARRLARELRIKERTRAKALKAAAKVVIDYRPVMSRIINDYLFRCPSWHYAHLLSRNRVHKQKTNNVYVYRFSQPTHIAGYKECWGKSCHTAELPYVFRSMDVIRSNYSTLSSIAQAEAPSAPEYPFTNLMNAYRGVVQETSTDSATGNDTDFLHESSSSSSSSFFSNQTKSFQRILRHFFDDYFQLDADDEISADMAQRWVAFARTGTPNYEDSKVEWVPWRYIPGDQDPTTSSSGSGSGSGSPHGNMLEKELHPLDRERLEAQLWREVQNKLLTEEEKSEDDNKIGQHQQQQGVPSFGGGDSQPWVDERLGRAYRQRALEALDMEVVEEDELRTELKRTQSSTNSADSDNPFFSLNFFSNLGMSNNNNNHNHPNGVDSDDDSPREAIRQIQRVAQEMGVLGTGLRGEERRGQPHNYWDDDFFPQLLELMWPPEGRLVERDCSCDFWDRIRYRY